MGDTPRLAAVESVGRKPNEAAACDHSVRPRAPGDGVYARVVSDAHTGSSNGYAGADRDGDTDSHPDPFADPNTDAGAHADTGGAPVAPNR